MGNVDMTKSGRFFAKWVVDSTADHELLLRPGVEYSLLLAGRKADGAASGEDVFLNTIGGVVSADYTEAVDKYILKTVVTTIQQTQFFSPCTGVIKGRTAAGEQVVLVSQIGSSD